MPVMIARTASVGLALLISAIIAGCTDSPDVAEVRRSREVMGTFAEVTAIAAGGAAAEAAVEAAYARLDDVNRLMSDYREDSDIGRLNRLPVGEDLTVSPETFHVLEQAARFGELTGGAFDVTYRPLKGVWKQAAKQKELPDEATLAEALAKVGWRKLKLAAGNRAVSRAVEGLEVDLGGIAKGYALDLAAEALRKAGATAGLVNVGGDIVGFGRQKDGTPWRVGVRHPFRQALFCKLKIEDRAVATSGVQQRFFEIDGRRYSHIIDPRTGRPAEQAPSVTVIAPDGLTADAWATACSVLAVEEGQRLIEAAPGVEVLWIWGTPEEPRTTRTSGFDRFLLQE